jgi:hypothetical protein
MFIFDISQGRTLMSFSGHSDLTGYSIHNGISGKTGKIKGGCDALDYSLPREFLRAGSSSSPKKETST